MTPTCHPLAPPPQLPAQLWDNGDVSVWLSTRWVSSHVLLISLLNVWGFVCFVSEDAVGLFFFAVATQLSGT